LAIFPLVLRQSRNTVRTGVYHDKDLEDAGNITINNDNYVAAQDRVYNVKGFRNMNIKIENTGGTNGLEYTIEGSSDEFDKVSELQDADFDDVIKADTVVAFGDTVRDDVIDISPQSTAIRIRIKRETAGQDTTLQGIVSTN